MAIALDGDKLKPRTDQRKGGNGFGINEDGAGYTLTGVDRHGVAYKADGVFYDALKNFPVLEGVSHTVCNGTSPGHHVGVVCKRTNDVGDKRAQEVVVHSVNSNGGDVMPTLRACEHKGVDNQKDLGGGVYCP